MGNRSEDSRAFVPELSKTTLFRQEQSGVRYRIPALIFISDAQTFLAFAEKRKSARDSDAMFLVMRRGTRHGGVIQWSETQELSTARLPRHRSMNPCPVYEKSSQTLFLFFICVLGHTTEHQQISSGRNKARLCHITSKDAGRTWSAAADLTQSVIGPGIRDWATFAVGPGHGIQMRSGRLIVPAYVYYIHRRCFALRLPRTVKSHAVAFYSDDRGSTWHHGDRVVAESCECEMAEIVDRESRSYLYCNARSTKGCRVEALSVTSGEAFDRPSAATMLVEPRRGCQGSVVSVQAENDPTSWLLYSHPTDKRTRKDLGVYLNRAPLGGSGWTEPWIIHRGPSGYSDLTGCEDTRSFACVMECGQTSEIEEIAFVEFSLADLSEA